MTLPEIATYVKPVHQMNLPEIQRWATVAESKPEPVGLDELIRRLLDDWGLLD